eukprot:1162062-Pelagomonas_calceolata.AAC.7
MAGELRYPWVSTGLLMVMMMMVIMIVMMTSSISLLLVAFDAPIWLGGGIHVACWQAGDDGVDDVNVHDDSPDCIAPGAFDALIPLGGEVCLAFWLVNGDDDNRPGSTSWKPLTLVHDRCAPHSGLAGGICFD